jgi:hypothetical protein
MESLNIFLGNAFLALAYLIVKTAIIAILATCDLNRNIPRICTPEIDGNDNFLGEVVDSTGLRERMQELLDQILKYFEAKESEEEEIC